MEPLGRPRSGGRRGTNPLEQLAQRVAERVLDLVIHALDVNALLAQLDLNAVLDRIDVQALLGRMDLNPLVAQLDMNAVLARVDVGALLGRVDLNALLEQVDLNALIQRVDVEALVTQTDFGEIIAKQTSGVASTALDAVRSQTVGLDGSIDRGVWRLVRRNAPRPAAPPLLRSPAET